MRARSYRGIASARYALTKPSTYVTARRTCHTLQTLQTRKSHHRPQRLTRTHLTHPTTARRDTVGVPRLLGLSARAPHARILGEHARRLGAVCTRYMHSCCASVQPLAYSVPHAVGHSPHHDMHTYPSCYCSTPARRASREAWAAAYMRARSIGSPVPFLVPLVAHLMAASAQSVVMALAHDARGADRAST